MPHPSELDRGAALAEYLQILERRDTGAAVRFATSLVEDGVPVADVLQHVVAPAQVIVGDRWHLAEIGVADEHAATAISETVVSAVAGRVERPPTAVSVVVTCAEGDWHSLPARIVAELLADFGHDVTFLGPSLPVQHLRRLLERLEPDVLAVSCSTPLAFEGVLSFVLVAHELGCHVAVGGRAMNERRAMVLGADLWAADAATLGKRLGMPLRRSRREPLAPSGTAMELAISREELVAAAMADLYRTFPPLAGYDERQRARTREDLVFILQFAEAAVVTDDDALFEEFLDWLTVLLRARGLGEGTVEAGLRSLTRVTTHPRLLAVLGLDAAVPGA